MAVDDRARQALWSRLDEVIGEGPAAILMKMYRPAYEALVARQASGEEPPDVVTQSTPSQDRERHELWRRLDEVLGAEPAWTLIQLWDEAGRQKRLGSVRAA